VSIPLFSPLFLLSLSRPLPPPYLHCFSSSFTSPLPQPSQNQSPPTTFPTYLCTKMFRVFFLDCLTLENGVDMQNPRRAKISRFSRVYHHRYSFKRNENLLEQNKVEYVIGGGMARASVGGGGRCPGIDSGFFSCSQNKLNYAIPATYPVDLTSARHIIMLSVLTRCCSARRSGS